LAALWLLASIKLHRRDVPWTALLPGAVLVAVGIEAVHVFTVSFLADKLANASALYGVLGLATTLLFVLYLIGRLAIFSSAELNSVAWEAVVPVLARHVTSCATGLGGRASR